MSRAGQFERDLIATRPDPWGQVRRASDAWDSAYRSLAADHAAYRARLNDAERRLSHDGGDL